MKQRTQTTLKHRSRFCRYTMGTLYDSQPVILLRSAPVCRRVPVAGPAEFGSAVRTRRSHMSLCVTAAAGPDFTPVTTLHSCSRRPGRRGGESDTDRRLRCPRAGRWQGTGDRPGCRKQRSSVIHLGAISRFRGGGGTGNWTRNEESVMYGRETSRNSAMTNNCYEGFLFLVTWHGMWN